MLFPKNRKFQKEQKRKGKHFNRREGEVHLVHGKYGLRVLESGQLTAKQLETVQKVILRKMQHAGKLWLKIFPSIPRTAKPREVRMGKGKGKVSFWVAKIRSDQIIIEIDGNFSPVYAKEILFSAARKLPFKSCFVHGLF
uniref:Ribosomal protein L16 n=1 Tax=Goniomonas avonlea TaxID=1255295 RepID=A0A348G6K8_9CRYP|nr:ribosomal protein L16 [Goniomonas avonlea]